MSTSTPVTLTDVLLSYGVTVVLPVLIGLWASLQIYRVMLGFDHKTRHAEVASRRKMHNIYGAVGVFLASFFAMAVWLSWSGYRFADGVQFPAPGSYPGWQIAGVVITLVAISLYGTHYIRPYMFSAFLTALMLSAGIATAVTLGVGGVIIDEDAAKVILLLISPFGTSLTINATFTVFVDWIFPAVKNFRAAD